MSCTCFPQNTFCLGFLCDSKISPIGIVREADVQKYMFTISGAISFYVYIVPLGLINIFLRAERDKISFGLQPTRFFPKFSIKLCYCQKRQNFRFMAFTPEIRLCIYHCLEEYIQRTDKLRSDDGQLFISFRSHTTKTVVKPYASG